MFAHLARLLFSSRPILSEFELWLSLPRRAFFLGTAYDLRVLATTTHKASSSFSPLKGFCRMAALIAIGVENTENPETTTTGTPRS
jgi:hypothetical protein